jgi:hypothetical protein
MRGSGDRCVSSDVRGSGDRCVSNDVRGSGDRCVSSDVRGSSDRCVSSDVRGSGDRCVSSDVRGSRDRFVSSDVRGSGDRCVSSQVRECGDPGGGPERETDYEPVSEKLLGVPDEILVLERATEARIPDPANVRAQEVPGEQTTVAAEASIREQALRTARLLNRANHTHHVGRRRG